MPTPVPRPTASATRSSGPSSVGGTTAEYFQAVDDQAAVDGLAAPDSPAVGYGGCLAKVRTASATLVFRPNLDAEIQAVDGGFDLVDAARDRTLAFRDVEVDSHGHERWLSGVGGRGPPLTDG